MGGTCETRLSVCHQGRWQWPKWRGSRASEVETFSPNLDTEIRLNYSTYKNKRENLLHHYLYCFPAVN
jgi:hypothetical protein